MDPLIQLKYNLVVVIQFSYYRGFFLVEFCCPRGIAFSGVDLHLGNRISKNVQLCVNSFFNGRFFFQNGKKLKSNHIPITQHFLFH